tara:strand:- start:13 stop:402 length:390 start_codon:yes stop_codon:yes gene_type:complete
VVKRSNGECSGEDVAPSPLDVAVTFSVLGDIVTRMAGEMFTGAFALGIVIISKIAFSTHLMHILFGNVLGVQQSALLLILVASVIALLVVWFAYRPLLLYAFGPQQAQALLFSPKQGVLMRFWRHRQIG